MSDDRELLAAYLDGVGELTSDERKRVEALIDADPEIASEADATRAMLGKLRALPDDTGAPDFRALEAAIAKALPPAKPRGRFRTVVPMAALSSLAAMFAVFVATRHVEPARAVLSTPITHDAGSEATPVGDDGAGFVFLGDDDVDLDALDADDDAALDAMVPDDVDFAASAPDPFGAHFGARIDTLDDASMDRVEHWLEKGG